MKTNTNCSSSLLVLFPVSKHNDTQHSIVRIVWDNRRLDNSESNGEYTKHRSTFNINK